MRDKVRLTLYGLNNQQAIQFFQSLIDYSLNTDAFGFMNSPAAYVLELGNVSGVDAQITALQTWITDNPGQLYAYLCPADWDYSKDEVGSVQITSGGSGYTSAPSVTFSAPSSGTTASGTATIQNGSVVAVTVTAPGSGYTAAPTVTFSAPASGTTASGTATLATALNILAGDYSEPTGKTYFFGTTSSGTIGNYTTNKALVMTAPAPTAPSTEFTAAMPFYQWLANPKQQGLLAEGEILQSWGNWEGTEMTLDLLVNAGGTWASLATPAPIVLNWTAGTELSVALQNCLAFAFPDNTIKVAINSGYVQTHDEIHVCSTLDQLGEWVEQLTRIRFGSPVEIGVNGPTILAFDESYQPAPIQLAFTDFVGQPTWIKPNEMQVKLVMRGDLTLGGMVELPKGMQDNPGIVLTAASALPSTIRYKSTFSGKFRIIAMRHVGNSRSPDGASWVTIINCNPYA